MTRAAARSATLALIGLVLLGANPGAAMARAPRILVWDVFLQGVEEHELRWPVGVAAATPAEILVIDAYGSRLIIFKQAKGIWSVDRSVELPGPPVDIAHDGTRYIISLRGGTGLMSAEGPRQQLRSIPLPPGSVPGMVADQRGGGFLIHDSAGDQILLLDPDLKVTGEISIEGHPTALANAPGGGFFAAFADHATVRRYSAEGEELESFPVPGEGPVPAWPTGISVLPGGTMVIVDRHGARLVVLDAEGRIEGLGSRRGRDPGLLLFPAGITALPDGRLAVADQGNGRIQIFHRIKEESAP